MNNEWDIGRELGSGPLPESLVSPIDGAEMVLVPEGPFTMGITEEELLQILMLDQKQNPIFVTETPTQYPTLESYFTANSLKKPARGSHGYGTTLPGESQCSLLFLSDGTMRGPMPDGPANRCPLRLNGRKRAVEQTADSGRGATNSSLTDVILENTAWRRHRKSVFSTKV